MTLKPIVIYIAGYGRSGSTVLDILLGNHPKIASGGELWQLPFLWQVRDIRCTCGKAFTECALWQNSAVKEYFSPQLADQILSIEKLSHIYKLIGGKIDQPAREIYRDYHRSLFGSFAKHTGKEYIVDSSQSSWPVAGRFLALQQIAGLEVYVIHLVRNGLDTMQSLVITGSNRALENIIAPPKWAALRAAFGWVSSNLLVSMLRPLVKKDHYLQIRYEDLIMNPDDALNKIGTMCNINTKPLIETILSENAFHVNHLVGGNRVRFQKEIILKREIKELPGEKLKKRDRMLFWLIGGWLNKFYGY